MKAEEIQNIENAHIRFGLDMFFNGSKQTDGALFLYSDKINDVYWNYATQLKFSSDKIKQKIEETIAFFKEKRRWPAFYITPATKPKELPNALIELGFSIKVRDTWMLWRGGELKEDASFTAEQVKTEKDSQDFVGVFKKAYCGITPDEPYGALPQEYWDYVYKIALNPKIKSYLVKSEGEPAGMVSLASDGKYACIYLVGTVPEHRKKGIGSFLTLAATREALKSGANTIFLQTEAGSYNEKLYESIGFKTEFIGEEYVLTD